MNYGSLLSRAWDIIWHHKFLILLGVLVALSSTGNNSLSTSNNWRTRAEQTQPGTPPDLEGAPPDWEGMPEMPQWGRELGAGVSIALAIIVGAIALAIGLLIWAISTIARGGLIAGASTIDAGGASSFGQSFRAGWQRGWTLLGIGILPGIPAFLLLLLSLGAAGLYAGWSFLIDSSTIGPVLGTLGVIGGLLACILLPLTLILTLLSTFAYQAAMQEKMGVLDAYRRGTSVLFSNIGSAIILFLIQIAASVVIGLLLFLPSIILLLCCLLWPILMLIQGAIAAYFTTMWTLAWRRWTGAVAAGTV